MYDITRFYNFHDTSFMLLMIPLALWVLFWKAYAIWIAVKKGQKKWFIALLVLNTMSILELIYVFYFAKKKWSDVRNSVNRIMK